MIFCTLLCVHCSLAIILMGKRELVALLSLVLVSSDDCVALSCGTVGFSVVCDFGIS